MTKYTLKYWEEKIHATNCAIGEVSDGDEIQQPEARQFGWWDAEEQRA